MATPLRVWAGEEGHFQLLGLVLGSRVYVHSSEVSNRNGGVSVMVRSIDLSIDVKRSFEILEGLCRVSLEAIGGALETKQFSSFFTPLLVCCLLDSYKTQGSVVIFNCAMVCLLVDTCRIGVPKPVRNGIFCS